MSFLRASERRVKRQVELRDPHGADPATYTVTAERQAYGWDPHIDGVGATQTRSLADAEDSFDVAIVPRKGA